MQDESRDQSRKIPETLFEVTPRRSIYPSNDELYVDDYKEFAKDLSEFGPNKHHYKVDGGTQTVTV